MEKIFASNFHITAVLFVDIPPVHITGVDKPQRIQSYAHIMSSLNWK